MRMAENVYKKAAPTAPGSRWDAGTGNAAFFQRMGGSPRLRPARWACLPPCSCRVRWTQLVPGAGGGSRRHQLVELGQVAGVRHALLVQGSRLLGGREGRPATQ